MRNGMFLPYQCIREVTVLSNYSHHGGRACEPWGSSGRSEHLPSSSHQRTPAVQQPSESTCCPAAIREHLPASGLQRTPAVQQLWDCRDDQPFSGHQTAENTCRPAAIREHLPSSSHQRPPAVRHPSDGSHSPQWAPRKLRMWKHKILAPESWDRDQRNDFSEPGRLHLPKHRKALNSLPGDIWFSLTYSPLLTFSDFVAKLLYDWPPPPVSSGQFSQGHWRCCRQGLSPKTSPRIKPNSQLSDCAYFSSLHTPLRYTS